MTSGVKLSAVGNPFTLHSPAAIFAYMDSPSPPPRQPNGTEREPRVIAAPGMLDCKYTVIREDDETDAEYEARYRLFAVLLDHAKR